MEKIKIAELSLDDKALIASTAKIKKELDELKKRQKSLTTTTDEGRQAFTLNAAEMKRLSKEYNSGIKILSERNKALEDAENREQLLNIALNTEVTTIAAAREQNKLLNQLRNTASVTTKEGAEEIENLNAKLDANNELIKSNADAYLKQKINIGNYREEIKGALQDLNPFNGGLSGFIERANESGGAGKLLSTSLKTIATGFIGATKAAVAFLFTPIGATLAIIAGAFAAIRVAMARSEESTNKIRKAFSAFSGIVSRVLKSLEPLGEFLIDGIVIGLELAEKAIYSALDALSSGLRVLGFEDAAKSVSGFNDELRESSKVAKELEAVEQRINKERREAQKVQNQFERDAEKLRQIRDDESKSISERQKANDQLAVTLRQQATEEIAFKELLLERVAKQIELDGERNELLDERANIQNEILEIQNRITGQESEQLTNRVALQREAADRARDAAQKRIEIMEQEFELTKEQQRFESENLEILRSQANEEIKILDEKLRNRLLSETEYQTEKLRIQNDIKAAEKQAEDEEIERIRAFEDRKRELQNEIALANAEDESARKLLKAEQDFQEHIAELERLELNEREKTELLRLLEEERDLVIDEIKSADFQKQLDDYKTFSDKEIQARQANANEVSSIASQLTGILTGILGDSLGAKLASLALDAIIQSSLVKTQTAASQATNLAQATAVAPPPFNLPFIAQATAQNAIMAANSAQAISRILASAAIKGIGTIASGIKFEKGGMTEINGASHAQGGVPIYAGNQYIGEAEGGEGIGILNRAAFGGFMDFNNSFLSGRSGGGRFEGGGIITQAVRPSFDSKSIAMELAQAYSQLPNPIVSVEDINDGQSNYAQVVNGANL